MLIYRIAISFLAPLMLIVLGLRLLLGRSNWADVQQRLGMGRFGAVRAGDVIWVHVASVGEANSAKTLILQMLETDPKVSLIVTTNTVTGRATVQAWQNPRISAVLAPLDLRLCLRLFTSNWHPDALISVENELWPNRLVTFKGPVILVSARMSKRSAARWQRMPGLARTVLGRIDLISAQDSASEARFVALGARQKVIAAPVSLKETTDLPPPDPAVLDSFEKVFERSQTLLAASTHDGEETMVLAGFLAARARKPGMKLILAPRHPDRGGEVAQILTDLGLRFQQRSQGAAPKAAMDVYLADTLGEMPLWYALAGTCFVGGSLVDKGGHTPFEPAAARCAILHGPHVDNFSDSYRTLDRINGAICVSNPLDLGQSLANLTEARRSSLAQNAHSALIGDSARSLVPLLAALSRLPGLSTLAPGPRRSTPQPKRGLG